jgi:syntaxin 8
MSNPNQLYLLADHIKLSLLERKRAQTLDLDGDDGDDTKDGHISRSLDQFRDGLVSLKQQRDRLEHAGDERFVSSSPLPSRAPLPMMYIFC